jgi:hypothetical protein
MDLLRRAFTEHPVASWTIIALESVALFVVVWLVFGTVVVPYGALAYLAVTILLWHRLHAEAGPRNDHS